ncbi:WxL domain-containing protein [Listeria aquatica]|uniref:WxL domain-containing protein n=1 Tax=Listeria aquatica TaxID=1494960 RepID=UPI003CFF557D
MAACGRRDVGLDSGVWRYGRECPRPNNKITLHVPAETVKLADETYTSTLTWTLSSTP